MIPLDDLVVKQQDATGFIVLESGDLFTVRNTRRLRFSTPESILTRKNRLKKGDYLNVQNLDAREFFRASVSLKYLLKSEITEIGLCPKAFKTA